MMRTLLIAATAWACVAGVAAAQEKEKHTTDSLETVKKNLAEGKAILLDVREDAEWNAGHLKLARLLPMSRFSDPDRQKATAEKELDKKKIIYAHCKAGGRCLRFAELMKPLGYDVRPLKQGYEELVKAGFEKAEEGKK